MLKDFIVTSKQIAREHHILLGCFLVALGVNIYSIIRYSTPLTEIFTQIGYVIIITALFYGLSILVRLIVWGVRLLIRRWKA